METGDISTLRDGTFLELKKQEVFFMVQGYCMKCKASRDISGATQVKMKNGRDAIKGTCATCSCNMYKIGKL